MKKLFIVITTVMVLFGCMQNIPWEQRWAGDYCNTIDWVAQGIDPTSDSTLCALAEKHQITLQEAQGIVFWLTALGSLSGDAYIKTIGEYTDKVEVYLQTPSLSLSNLFTMIVADSEDPRWAMLTNLINYSIFTFWGQDPIATYALQPKDIWLLRAHLNNVRQMIGYQVPAKNI